MQNRNKTKKEQVYDEKIAHLMDQILTICAENDIGIFLHAYIDGPENKGRSVTSIIPDSSAVNSEINSTLRKLSDIAMTGKTSLSNQVQVEKPGVFALYNPEFMTPDRMNQIMKRFEK